MIAAPIFAMVVAISDGDTLTVRPDGGEQLRVRVAEIDAPESRQPFGAAAKRSLSDLCIRERAEIRPQKTDRYGRTVARPSARLTSSRRGSPSSNVSPSCASVAYIVGADANRSPMSSATCDVITLPSASKITCRTSPTPLFEYLKGAAADHLFRHFPVITPPPI